MNNVVVILNTALAVITMLVSPIIMFAGWLMSPDWVTGDMFGLRDKMYQLWITVSNILYFVYAILLIVIAIATIFNVEKYSYKALLPRLFLGIILIPFTWWFVQFVISTATVVTATVLQIPGTMMSKLQNPETETFWTKNNIPKHVKASEVFNSTSSVDCDKTPDQCTSFKKIMESGSGIYSPMLVYAYGIFKVQDVKKIQNINS